jgi:hypothetical protein
MLDHVKVIGFSVGLLVILSVLSSVSFAVARHRTSPAPEKAASAINFQSAQASVVAGAALRSIASGY